jgi:long-subunit acyl-CoA synthetase (AMP-forming)
MVASWVLQKNKAIRINNKDGIDSIKILAFLPFHHIFGFMVIVIWFGFFGRTMVFLDNLSPEAIQYACKKHQVTHFFAVPLVWENVVSSILNEAKRQGKDKLLQRVIKFSN